jgi:hypothetical protein
MTSTSRRKLRTEPPFRRILRPLLSIPAEQMVVCGISMGHPREQASGRLMPRADVEAFASFKGFEE